MRRLPRRISSADPPKKTTTNTIRNGLAARPIKSTPAAQTRMASVCAEATTFHQQSPKQRPLLPLPKPSPPLLLLQGDQLHVNPQGVARSCYQLQDDTAWSIEERYNLADSKKSFVVSSPYQATTIIDIQEIDTRQVGTGGVTWEASLAMALYFARHPERLQGNVVELGSGVGLGGILLNHMARASSITLTDGCAQVLEQCRANIHSHGLGNHMRTLRLDWNDSNDQTKQFNTVLACDCAYRNQDVAGLVKTLKSLLSSRQDDNQHNRIHLFGPYNRVAYQELIQRMDSDEDMRVQVEVMELRRFRLATSDENTDWNSMLQDATSVTDPFASCTSFRRLEDELKDASQSSTKFLHLTATYWNRDSSQKESERARSSSLSDID